ncbi:hypothetical protein HanIR_Chr02g0060201 [Helianthus annuus]|nr:hypothetical protein HanIR_Chr02g0060201 [Helianthus annuus]
MLYIVIILIFLIVRSVNDKANCKEEVALELRASQFKQILFWWWRRRNNDGSGADRGSGWDVEVVAI